MNNQMSYGLAAWYNKFENSPSIEFALKSSDILWRLCMGAFGLCWLYVLSSFSQQFYLALCLLPFVSLVWQHFLARHVWQFSPHRIQRIACRGEHWHLVSANQVYDHARLLPTSCVVANIIILHFATKTGTRVRLYVAPDSVPLAIYKKLRVRVKFLRLIPEQSTELSHG